jgi:hypothetical protein
MTVAVLVTVVAVPFVVTAAAHPTLAAGMTVGVTTTVPGFRCRGAQPPARTAPAVKIGTSRCTKQRNHYQRYKTGAGDAFRLCIHSHFLRPGPHAHSCW